MEIKEISRADILDILFEGRNKDYGAYDLRKTYNRRLTKALAVTASVCLLLVCGYTWAGKVRPSKAITPMVDDVNLAAAVKEPPVVPPPVVPKPQPQVATIRITPPRIMPDDQVKPADVPPPNDAADNVRIGTETHDGIADGDIVEAPSGNGVSTGVIEQPKKPEEDNTIYTSVQIESSYPAGIQAWLRFLKKNYTVPEEAINDNISGTVLVQFIVDKEGNVSDVQAVSGPELLSAEAVRVIRKSGKWTPAIQNGRKVNSYKRQPIVIRLSDQ